MRYMIYRLPCNNPVKFMSFSTSKCLGGIPSKGDYVLVYVGETTKTYETHVLDDIFEKLNIDRPVDYRVPSLSVSEVIAIWNKGKIDYWYVDSIGFKKIWEKGE